jgi:hypothetical protein
MPYFRAKAGMAWTLPLGIGKAEAGEGTIDSKSQPYTAMDARAEIRCFFNFTTSCDIAPPRPRCNMSSISSIILITARNRS